MILPAALLEQLGDGSDDELVPDDLTRVVLDEAVEADLPHHRVPGLHVEVALPERVEHHPHLAKNICLSFKNTRPVITSLKLSSGRTLLSLE